MYSYTAPSILHLAVVTFGNHLTLDFIFGTEDGGNALAAFIDETGVFLRSLLRDKYHLDVLPKTLS
jgi:hypothetical protein